MPDQLRSLSLADLSRPWLQIPLPLSTEDLIQLTRTLDKPVLLTSHYRATKESTRAHRSVKDRSRGNRYDIFTALPESVLALNGPLHDLNARLDQINTIRAFSNRWRLMANPSTGELEKESLPFYSGIMGYASYEWGAAHVAGAAQTIGSALPRLHMAYYSWSYVYDSIDGQGFLTFSPLCTTEKRRKIIEAILYVLNSTSPSSRFGYRVSPWAAVLDKDSYVEKFTRVQNYLNAGDCYQINLTQRFDSRISGDSAALFRDLQASTQTPYSCYLSIDDDQQILSFSPEQFIEIRQDKIVTRPIKGTARNDQAQETVDALLRSKKNQAENLMIVDLLRNDLSRFCQLNSVKVEELFALESFSNVHHLVSTVTGRLKPDITPMDAFLYCFPGGSITGAPKIRAMEIIDELEEGGRDAYCGSVFYWSDTDQFDSNILIRTIIRDGNALHCWGGGGIVIDSNAEDEYEESVTKIQNLMEASQAGSKDEASQ